MDKNEFLNKLFDLTTRLFDYDWQFGTIYTLSNLVKEYTKGLAFVVAKHDTGENNFLINEISNLQADYSDFSLDRFLFNETPSKIRIENNNCINEPNYGYFPIFNAQKLIGFWVIVSDNDLSMEYFEEFSRITEFIKNFFIILDKRNKYEAIESDLRKKELYLTALNKIAYHLVDANKNFPWDEILAELGKASEVSRITVSIVRDLDKEPYAESLAEWCNKNIKSYLEAVNIFQLNETTQEWFEILSNGKIIDVLVKDIVKDELRMIFSEQDTVSLLVIPLMFKDEFFGFIGFDDCVKEREWSETEKKYLITASEYISQTLKKQQIEKNLNDSENMFKSFADYTYDMEYWVDPNDQLLFVSKACERITGYTQQEFLSNQTLLPSLVLQEDYNKYKMHLDFYHTSEGTSHEAIVEFRIKSKKGEIKYIQHGCSAIYNNSNEYFGRRSSNRDITNMKKAQLALKEINERNDAMLSAMPDLLFLFSNDGICLDCWSQDDNILFAPREKFLNRHINEILPNKLTEIITYKLKELLEGSKTVEFEYSLKIKGEMRYFENRAVRCGENRILSLVRDITEQRKTQFELVEAKEKAVQADKMKSQFLAQMSHEIRTPINAILSLNSLIKEEVEGKIGNEIYSLYSNIDSASRRLIRTIDLLLNMSEVQTGKYDANYSDFDLLELVKNITKEMYFIAKSKGLELNVNINTEYSIVYGDQYSIAQIIVNLIDNAIKYTPSGCVDLEISELEDKLKISVRDTGIGISEEFLPKLFDAFTQEEEGYIRSFEGTGLGLALVKHYCDINKATIKVISEKGKGTQFILHLNKHAFDKILVNN